MQKIQLIKKFIPAIALSMLAVGAAHAQEATVQPQGTSTLSRDQVRADTQAWHEAGLANKWRGENTPDIESTAYRAKYAQYLRLTGRDNAVASVSPGPQQDQRS